MPHESATYTARKTEGAGTVRALLTAALLIIIGCLRSQGSELSGETVRAWDEYTHRLNARVVADAHDQAFLWTDQSPERMRLVRQGEVLVAPVGENPRIVPHGLIHHWVGAMFLPDVTLDDVLKVVRDYDRYKDVYAPNVLDSRVLRRMETDDVFSLLLLNKALVAKVALNADFRSSYRRVDNHRWYSVGYSTRIREVEEYGQADQRALPEDTGHGFVWRLYSVSRFEQRDGGVYVELEGVALSRDVPSMLRWLVSPAIRTASKNSMLVSLQKTEEAVRATSDLAAVPGHKQTDVEQGSAFAGGITRPDLRSGPVPRKSFRAEP
jgi:hypothetical protein